MMFRIDDVSVNTDRTKLTEMLRTIWERSPDATIMLAMSPLVHATKDERVFPLILNAHSDWRVFYGVQRCGIPLQIRADNVIVASHGLVHVDHRLLERAAKEMSILVSCSLLNTKTWVAPFNKYDQDCIEICMEHGITLIRWEDDWQHLKFNDFDDTPGGKWYFHTHDFTLEQFKERLCPTSKPSLASTTN